MPINLAENPLSAAKVGSQDLTAAYIGVTQIFPNSTEITSWTGRGATSSYSNTSHSLTTSVTGPAGATFNLIGNNGAVGQTGLTKAVDGAESFSWSISSNDSCDAASRTISLTLQATGSTTLASPLGGRLKPRYSNTICRTSFWLCIHEWLNFSYCSKPRQLCYCWWTKTMAIRNNF